MKRATAVRGVKIRATYDHVHAAWRAGAVKDFYYGTLSDTDDTVVWIVDGAEYGKTDHGAVTGAVDAALAAAGIATVAFGAQWCGYRALHVVHADGAVTVDEYVTGEAVNDELEVAA